MKMPVVWRTPARARVRMLMIPLFLASSALSQAQTSTYYLTAGDQDLNFAVAHGAVVHSWTQQYSEEYPLAVSGGTIRTTGIRSGLPGGGYRLDGSPLMANFSHSVTDARFFDGATDGRHNYSVDYDTGNVYRFETDWSGAQLLFTGAAGDLGITYDASDRTLWILNFDSGEVRHHTLQGALLGSFSTGLLDTGALALDPSDGTLWLTSQITKGVLYQYRSAGKFLPECGPGRNGQHELSRRRVSRFRGLRAGAERYHCLVARRI